MSVNREKMNVHKALSELKILDARINDSIVETTFVVANKHSNVKIGGVPIADFAENAKASLKSIRTMISRRNAIKRAVTRSNASTVVTIGGVVYTVAEAIDMKAAGVLYLKTLRSQLESQYNSAKMAADKNNGDYLEKRGEDYIKSLYQGADMKNMADEIKKVRDDFMAAQTVELIDPVNAVKEAHTGILSSITAIRWKTEKTVSVP